MKRGKPLARSGFRPKPRPDRTPVVLVPLTRPARYARATMALPVPKDEPVRSEPYRRLVAALPCMLCGIEGFTQHAHGNRSKGMGLKTCDLFAFPLCAPRPGAAGCHAQLDQGTLFPKAARREIEQEWARRTVQFVIAAGQWPAGLPVPEWAS